MIKFRAHHFMCTVGFEEKGYSAPFIRNYQNIASQLKQDPKTPIQVTEGLDSICGPCPHKIGKNQCSKQAFIEELDTRHRAVLGLKNHQIVTWSESKALIRERMTLEKFHASCGGCEWKEQGMCEKALRVLIAELHPLE